MRVCVLCLGAVDHEEDLAKEVTTEPLLAVDPYSRIATRVWYFRAQVLSVYDGDTLDLLFDLGFDTLRKERVRLIGINCPEKNAPGGTAATLFTESWLEKASLDQAGQEWPLLARSVKGTGPIPVRERYRRFLVDLIRTDTEESLTKSLLSAGHGRSVVAAATAAAPAATPNPHPPSR